MVWTLDTMTMYMKLRRNLGQQNTTTTRRYCLFSAMSHPRRRVCLDPRENCAATYRFSAARPNFQANPSNRRTTRHHCKRSPTTRTYRRTTRPPQRGALFGSLVHTAFSRQRIHRTDFDQKDDSPL